MLPEGAIRLAGEILASAGLARLKPVSAAPVSGGGNNRVFRVDCGSRDFLLKLYFSHPDDPRDRCQADFAFTRYAWSVGMHAVAASVGVSHDQNAALYEFLPGRKLRAEEIGEGVLTQAAEFFAGINHGRWKSPAAAGLQSASEACFSISEHLECVEHRIKRLTSIDPNQALGSEALELVRDLLIPEWERLRVRLSGEWSAATIVTPVPQADRCLSPSDFGFHNALIQPDGTLRFFDFEYAGWDDPAKMLADFFCQPEIPVDTGWFSFFTLRALAGFDGEAEIRERALKLLPVYRIKWCCIMLNEFLKTDSSRRQFASHQPDLEIRKQNQLAKARVFLNRA